MNDELPGFRISSARRCRGRPPPVVLAAPFPLIETFQLHSAPSASKTIFLDFDGHVTSGTLWNDSIPANQN